MRKGDFMIDGEAAMLRGCWLTTYPEISIPQNSRTFNALAGSSQSQISGDTDTWTNRDIKLTICAMGRDAHEFANARGWLINKLNAPGYHTLVVYSDEAYTYNVALSAAITPTRPMRNNYVETYEISLTAGAFKRLRGYPDLVAPVTHGINKSAYNAYPLWHVWGSGDGVITINGITYNLADLPGECFIDSDPQQQDVYDASGQLLADIPQFVEYPVLPPGQFTVGIGGGITKLTLEPRWQTI